MAQKSSNLNSDWESREIIEVSNESCSGRFALHCCIVALGAVVPHSVAHVDAL